MAGNADWSKQNVDAPAASAEPEVAVCRSLVSPRQMWAPSYFSTAQPGGDCAAGFSSMVSGGGLGVFASMSVVSAPAPFLGLSSAPSPMLRQQDMNNVSDAGAPGGESAQDGADIHI